MSKRITYNKLIRDRIPELIRANGNEFSTEILSDDDYKQALRDKLVEEAHEVAEANYDDLIIELADIYEVLDALMKTYNVEREDVIKKQEQRRLERGAFENKIYLVWVE